MKDVHYTHIPPKKVLGEITFYRDVLEIFTLSRKLTIDPSSPSYSDKRDSRIALIAQNFSEYIMQLPLSIAEAEVTKDAAKKITTQLAIRTTIDYMLRSWSMLKNQACISEKQKHSLEEKMNSLKHSYYEWTASLTCSN